jgi:hypothetical protein
MIKSLISLALLTLIWSCGSSSGKSSTKLGTFSTSKTQNFHAYNSNNFENLTRADTSYISHVKTLGLNGEALDIDISDDGDYAYIASGDYGLQVVDISDPEHPKLLHTLDSYGYVNHVEVIGDIVYLSYIAQTWDDYERVNAYNISSPYQAEYLGFYEGYKSNNHKSFDCDNYLYQIVDNNFYIINKEQNDYQTYKLYQPYSLMIIDGYAYIANGRDGLTILKVRGYGRETAKLTNP